MNIVVIGVGGIGGFFGGKLAQAGFKVTFVARGKQYEAIKQNGLLVKSIDGDFKIKANVTNDVTTIKQPDLIILGVKSWQIESVAKTIKGIVTPKTMVLPLQNGADNAQKLLTILNPENVLAGLSRIVSKVESPGVINHFAFLPQLIIGEFDNSKTNRINQVKVAFNTANVICTISEDIHLDIWRKFLFITTVSGIGAITRVEYGEIQKDKNIKEIMLKTANEVKAIANALGVNLTKDDIDLTMLSFINSDKKTTASMQRDLMDCKPSELENFNGYIVSQGIKLGIETPINAFIYHCLMPQERLARKQG